MSKNSIACIAFNGRNVFIAKRIPKGQMGNRWEFPGGKVEEGETEEQAIHREFQEEFGVDVSVGEKIARANFKHNGETFFLDAYAVTLPHDGISKKFTLTEHTEYRWAELAEIPELDFVDSDMLIYPQVCKYLAGIL